MSYITTVIYTDDLAALEQEIATGPNSHYAAELAELVDRFTVDKTPPKVVGNKAACLVRVSPANSVIMNTLTNLQVLTDYPLSAPHQALVDAVYDRAPQPYVDPQDGQNYTYTPPLHIGSFA